VFFTTEAQKDACFLFDTNEGHLTRVCKSPDNNVYVFLPHNLLTTGMPDGVLQTAMDRLTQFYTTTFWENAAGYQCQLAAMGLCLRGKNVDRAFWTKGCRSPFSLILVYSCSKNFSGLEGVDSELVVTLFCRAYCS